MALIKKPGTTKGIDLNSSSSGAGADPQGTAAPGAGGRVVAPVMQPGVVLQERYVIEGTLGIGGMSVVYRGRDLRFKDVVRPCAIKEMYQSAPDSNTRLLNLKNFEREAGLLATLQHPAIPKVFDFFEENGRVYLILELIQGKDLETVLDEAKGPLPEERVARWAVQLCEVLSYLHNQKPKPIVFRDMKPSNVMVTADDRIILIDFGIARSLVRTRGTVIGTEGYSPPEQYKGIAEPQSDLYALGATLHHLLTASDPRTETPFTFHERPLRQLNPQISPEFAAVVEKALSYDMKTRWASAEEMRLALLQTPTLRSKQGGGTATAGKVALSRASGAATTELVWRFVCEDEVRSSPCVSMAWSSSAATTRTCMRSMPVAASFAGNMPPKGAFHHRPPYGMISSSWDRKMAQSTPATSAAASCAGHFAPVSRCARRHGCWIA